MQVGRTVHSPRDLFSKADGREAEEKEGTRRVK